MDKCSKCNTKITQQRWVVDETIYCSPRCERGYWDSKTQKFSTKTHRFGDKQVKDKGVAGFVQEHRVKK
jgi:hypothetical protein